MTAASARSAYPYSLDDLIPRAERLAVQLGQIPSRNRLKAELKIGAPKANAVLAELKASGFDPTNPPAELATLHLVTDTDQEPAPERVPEPVRAEEPADM